MQTQEHKQFRLGPQALAIAAVALMALAAPVAMVVFSLRSMTEKKVEPPVSEAAAPLEKALEDIASKSLAPVSLGADQARVEIITDDPEGELIRIEGVLKVFKASALPAEADGQQARLLVTLAASQVPEFIAACEKKDLPKPGSTTTVIDQARTLVEIVIKKKNSP